MFEDWLQAPPVSDRQSEILILSFDGSDLADVNICFWLHACTFFGGSETERCFSCSEQRASLTVVARCSYRFGTVAMETAGLPACIDRTRHEMGEGCM